MSSRPLSSRQGARRPNTAGKGGLSPLAPTDTSTTAAIDDDHVSDDNFGVEEDVVLDESSHDIDELIVDATKQPSQAPIELTSQFLTAVMRGDFDQAAILCTAILQTDPDNLTALEFQDVIRQRQALDALPSSSSASEDEDDGDNVDHDADAAAAAAADIDDDDESSDDSDDSDGSNGWDEDEDTSRVVSGLVARLVAEDRRQDLAEMMAELAVDK
eukprot:m.9623 g.9623  ORF g.9623 m.9623 type:complete len:216 (-) comp9463_c0_seq1:117-764(-)